MEAEQKKKTYLWKMCINSLVNFWDAQSDLVHMYLSWESIDSEDSGTDSESSSPGIHNTKVWNNE